jgi:hypothetical protein
MNPLNQALCYRASLPDAVECAIGCVVVVEDFRERSAMVLVANGVSREDLVERCEGAF